MTTLDGARDGAAPHRVPLADLRRHCAAVLRASGLPDEVADLVADSLVDAEGRGVRSHGVVRTRVYSERLRAGLLDATARPAVVRETAGTVLLDARNAIGHVGALAATELAADRALAGGACAVGVSGSNHCGALGYFARRAARRGVALVAMSTAPPTMVYFGGRTRAVGTNPLCLAVPRAGGEPLVVDMATSATARGRIILADQAGEPIPEGWAVDRDGRATTDAAAALAGSVLPFSGPKGSGLAMMVDLLAGGMVSGVGGADIGDMYEDWTRPQRVGHLVVALDPDAWFGREAFADHVARFAAGVAGLPPGEGFDAVRLPGQVEDEALELARREGAAVALAVLDDLDRLAEELGVAHRLTAGPPARPSAKGSPCPSSA